MRFFLFPFCFILFAFTKIKSQPAFRDNFIGKYYCLVKYQSTTHTSYEYRDLYISIDTAYSNRIILTDSLWSPSRFIKAVNLYSDSTYRDTISSASGGLYNGHFYDLDSVYFHRAIPLGPGGGALMEYWGKKQPGAVGVKETELENNIIASPNPASQKLFIKTKNGFDIEACHFYTIDGKELPLYEKAKGEYDISSLPNGSYFLQVRSPKTTLTKKIIVEH